MTIRRTRGKNAKDYYIEPRWGVGDTISFVQGKEVDFVVETVAINIKEKLIDIVYYFRSGHAASESECFMSKKEYLEKKREILITAHQNELALIDEELKKI